MKWGIIGYGSIGKRHATNLISLNEEVYVVTKNKKCLHPRFASVGELMTKSKPDAIIICNETSMHIKAYKEIRSISQDIPLLIEKPIFEKAYNVSDDKNAYVAYCLRFHSLVKKIKDIIQNKKIIAASFYVGQYLPTWRNDRDYTETYSAKKELGGGVLRDLSHELDLAAFLLGDINLKSCKSGHVSNLDITSDDYFSGFFSGANNANINIEMNYLDRISQRFFILHTDDMTIKVDFIKAEINVNQKIDSFDLDKNEMYLTMLEKFGKKEYRNFTTFAEGINILNIIIQAEEMQTT